MDGNSGQGATVSEIKKIKTLILMVKLKLNC